MPWDVILPILIFAALLALFVYLLRRLGVLVATSREHDVFRRSVADLATRIDATLGSISSQIDAVRRQQIEATMIAEPLDKALEALLRYEAEAHEIPTPPAATVAKSALIDEIDRADRALQMVEHGCAILASQSHHPRLGEAQTAIKRGYLNVLHAREAIARHALDIESTRTADELRWITRSPLERDARPGGLPPRR